MKSATFSRAMNRISTALPDLVAPHLGLISRCISRWESFPVVDGGSGWFWVFSIHSMDPEWRVVHVRVHGVFQMHCHVSMRFIHCWEKEEDVLEPTFSCILFYTGPRDTSIVGIGSMMTIGRVS